MYYIAVSLASIIFTNNDQHPVYIAPICLERMHRFKGKDEAFGIVEVNVGCEEDSILIQMYRVGGFARGKGSMAVIYRFFWESEEATDFQMHYWIPAGNLT